MDSIISTKSRIRGAIYGLAVCDALGGPVEFHARGSFPKVTTMLPNDNFGLPPGQFTDDTSMTLCLAHSLLEKNGKTDVIDQVSRYIAWWKEGYMSSTGHCFDIGVSTRAALTDWEIALERFRADPGSPSDMSEEKVNHLLAQINKKYNHESKCGNGSLMRVLPVGFMALNEWDIQSTAKESSETTHPHPRCVDACIIYSILIFRARQAANKDELAKILSNHLLRKSNDLDPELLTRLKQYTCLDDWKKTPSTAIKSTGYVIDSLEASLWALFSTETFKDGAIRVVNLGDDADTVGAIYGGLAGTVYGCDAIPKEWISEMKMVGLLDDVVDKICNSKLA